MKAKHTAIIALAVPLSLSATTAQAGFFEKHYHMQRIEHHTNAVAYHLRRYKDNMEDVNHRIKLKRGWHRSRAKHHQAEYKEHSAKLKYHHKELAEEGHTYNYKAPRYEFE